MFSLEQYLVTLDSFQQLLPDASYKITEIS